MYKIGITEAGDAGLDLSWVLKLPFVDGAVVITKKITPQFIEAALTNKDKLILHATITGYGGTILEPNVPFFADELDLVCDLVNRGFPKEKVVIRVDPIIPTVKGFAAAGTILRESIKKGFERFRVSLIDMYPHVRERFVQHGLPLPYDGKFSPDDVHFRMATNMFETLKKQFTADGKKLRIEACAEPRLKGVEHTGCISAYDLTLLGLDPSDTDSSGPQRRNCLCYSGKTELLTNRRPCPNGCLYCYWRSKI